MPESLTSNHIYKEYGATDMLMFAGALHTLPYGQQPNGGTLKE